MEGRLRDAGKAERTGQNDARAVCRALSRRLRTQPGISSAESPAAQKVSEARLLIGTCLLLDGKRRNAADHDARIKQSLIPINQGRGTVLQLHALLEAGDENEAMKVVIEQFPRMGELLQLVSFQTLTFELGARYLERNEPRNAIICLQRVWSADRLLKHQQACLEDLESKLQAVEADPRG